MGRRRPSSFPFSRSTPPIRRARRRVRRAQHLLATRQYRDSLSGSGRHRSTPGLLEPRGPRDPHLQRTIRRRLADRPRRIRARVHRRYPDLESGLRPSDRRLLSARHRNAFAAGQRMATLEDLCSLTDVRFLDFGSGTELRMLINAPQGSDPLQDPPSVVVTPILLDGTVLPQTVVFTDDFAFSASASDFSISAFGTLLFDFQNSNGGLVYAEYSAFGEFSVGLNGACLTPVP